MLQSHYTNTVLWMTFSKEHTAGEYYDFSTYKNDGEQTTSASRPLWTNYVGGVYAFDGTDDHINLGDDPSFTHATGFSMSAWFFRASTPSVKVTGEIVFDGARIGALTTGRGRTLMRLNTARTITWYTRWEEGSSNQRYVTGASTLTSGVWHFVLGTADPATDTVHLYVDGVNDDGTFKGTYLNTIEPEQMIIGDDYVGSGNYAFEGMIDDYKIINHVMTATEALAMYNAEPTVANGGKR